MNVATHTIPTFTLAAIGDAIVTRRLLPSKGVAPAFDGLLSLLRDVDATVTNLEVVAHEHKEYPSTTCGDTYMCAPLIVLGELAGIGCDLFSAATNHAFDYGYRDVDRTLAAFANRGLPVAGLGMGLYEARWPAHFDTSAGRVALVNACTLITPGSRAGEQTAAMAGRSSVNPIDVETIYRLPDEYREQLLVLSNAVGFAEQKRSWLDRGLYVGYDWDRKEYLHFGDMTLEVTDSEDEIGYRMDPEDRSAVCEWVAEAEVTDDPAAATVHVHQGVDGKQNTTDTEVQHRTSRGCGTDHPTDRRCSYPTNEPSGS